MRCGGSGQAGFAEAFLGAGVGGNRKLERIAGLIDWGPVGSIVDGLRPGKTGRPPYAPLVMMRVLLLQQWYGLSDVEVCEALADRLSFRRFCALALDEATPDDTTLCRFRAALGAAGLAERLMVEVNRQLDARGLVLKRGTIVDATLIAAAVAPPTPGEGQVTDRDPEAGVAARKGRAIYGYKAHVAADEGTNLVREVLVTSADLHDTLAFASLIQGDEAAAYADRAYDSAANRAALAEAGVGDAIMHRARRNRPLRPWQTWQTWHNRALAPVRSGIERIFGTWKRSWGLRRMRYRGLAGNQTHLHLAAAAWNLLRATTLSAA